MKTPKHFLALIIATVFAIAGLGFAPSVFAASICDSNASDEVKAANGCPDTNAAPDIRTVVVSVLDGIIAILGLVAVVFIVIGGINYMTSAGDSGKVEKAKKTILYSVIGLIICALAFAIVNFVIANIIK